MNDFKPISKGLILRVSGTVQKFVRREGLCRLVVQSHAPEFTVFANFRLSDADYLKSRKVRKGSCVQLTGKVISFGSSAICLAESVLH